MQLYGDPPDLVRAFDNQHLLTMNEFAGSLMRIGKVDGARKIYKLVRDGYQENVQGVGFCILRVVIVARRSS